MDFGRLRSSTLNVSSSRGLGGLGSLYTFVGIGDAGALVGSSTGAVVAGAAVSMPSTEAGLLLRGGIIGAEDCGVVTGVAQFWERSYVKVLVVTSVRR